MPSALQVRKLGRDKIERKVQRVLDMVQMGSGGFAGRRPAQLSGAQQQRVASPHEPFGALEKQLREHMQFEIKHIHERLGVTSRTTSPRR